MANYQSKGNPAMVKGGPSLNPGGRKPTAPSIVRKGLAMAMREYVRPEEVAAWLCAVANGVEPPKLGPKSETPSETTTLAPLPPDWGHRLAAMKMILERAEGLPQQSVILQAQIDTMMRARDNMDDVIDVDSLEPAAAAALEAALVTRLGIGVAQQALQLEEETDE